MSCVYFRRFNYKERSYSVIMFLPVRWWTKNLFNFFCHVRPLFIQWHREFYYMFFICINQKFVGGSVKVHYPLHFTSYNLMKEMKECRSTRSNFYSDNRGSRKKSYSQDIWSYPASNMVHSKVMFFSLFS